MAAGLAGQPPNTGSLNHYVPVDDSRANSLPHSYPPFECSVATEATSRHYRSPPHSNLSLSFLSSLFSFFLSRHLPSPAGEATGSLCLSASTLEQFKVQYTTSEYHYTLYYYDLAGNLVKTVPPKGARPNFNAAFIKSVDSSRAIGAVDTPQHVFSTRYCYNSLNSVIAQRTPDAGVSQFWYDRLGRLVVSQNAQQNHDGNYSYTVYDALSRITEVGQTPQGTAMTQTVSQDSAGFAAWMNATTSNRTQITATVYDQPAWTMAPLMTQQNLRNRVSYTYTKNHATDGNFYTASYYTYDVHGNVDTLIQDYLYVPGMSTTPYKRICYDYDLVSGKVNGVDYQPGSLDGFYYRYQYDAENRLTNVLTSRDSITWEQDASYLYYKHGPLSRTVLGQLPSHHAPSAIPTT
jgi:hypothetical protein